MKAITSILFLLIAFETIHAQVTQEWVARFNGPENLDDAASSIALDGSGNIYVTGYSADSITSSDYYTIKYNSEGVKQWVARYDGPGNGFDFANSIAVDDSNNIYITGRSNDNSGNYDYATIKYNSNGIQQWVARYNGPGNFWDQAFSIAVDNSGNAYVTGASNGSGIYFDYATVKYNSAGVEQWVVRYNGQVDGADFARAIAVDGSGNVYVTGWSEGTGTATDYATIKYNSAGIEQWVARYNGPGNANDQPRAIAVDGSGNVYVTGNSVDSDTTDDYATIKYNSAGIQQWVARYNSGGASSIKVDGSGNVYVTGGSYNSGTASDYATIKYNSAGIQQWEARYNFPTNSDDIAYSLAIDGSANVYVTGYSFGSGTSGDYATVKYNSAGVQQWVVRYNGPGNNFDIPNSIVLDGIGNVYVTGYSTGSGTDIDYATIKYSQSTGIEQISSLLPERFSLSQNYPNPFNPKTIINYELTMFNYVSMKVYDVLGNEVATLVNEKQSPGTYKVEFDGSNLTSGVYFYKIETESFTDTKRMLMIK